MKFFFKCLAVFVILWVVFLLLDVYLLQFDLDFSGIVLLSGVLSLVLTIFYGWVDDSFIQHRQPGLEE